MAWAFWAVSAVLGVGLRFFAVHPVSWANPAFVTHTHSHIAFLGWVFNAFFALALRRLMVTEDQARAWAVFRVAQLAVFGMLVSYPFQGYGAFSIAASTLHLGCQAVFAWILWRRSRLVGVARRYLRAALVFLVLSGIGPLALGPLAAAGLRETPGYSLAIYFYLHCQYNGWFIFFLLALALSDPEAMRTENSCASRAFPWLLCGVVLTYALSTLWIGPPVWVRAVAVAGGLSQSVGCLLWFSGQRRNGDCDTAGGPWAVRLAAVAGVCWAFKNLLQLAGAFPWASAFVGHRFAVIGFLHLVFLGVVSPWLIAWGLRFRWLQDRRSFRWGVGFFLGGALATEGALAAIPLGVAFADWSAFLLGSAVSMAVGVGLIGTGLAFASSHPRQT